jgi:N-methylhydantoinase A
VDLRFKRQISELSIPLARGPGDDAGLEQLTEAFQTEYARRYGRGSIVLGAPMEIVNLRAVGLGRTIRASLDGIARTPVPEGTAPPRAGSRAVQRGRDDEMQPVPTFDGAALQPGHRIDGPALIDGSDTTIWIPPETTTTVDERATLVVEVQS